MASLILRALLLLSVHSAAFVGAAPVPKEQPKAKVPNYFPCELGTKWEYESDDDRTVDEVTKVRHEKDCKIVTITTTRPSTGAKAVRVFRVTPEAVVELADDKGKRMEVTQLRFPWKVGDTWSITHRGFGTLDSVVMKPEQVKVPAGNYEAFCISITLRNTPTQDFEIREYYADGIGRVMVTGYKAGHSPSVLKKFTPAPPK